MVRRPASSFHGVRRRVFLGGSCGNTVGDEHDWRAHVVVPALRSVPRTLRRHRHLSQRARHLVLQPIRRELVTAAHSPGGVPTVLVAAALTCRSTRPRSRAK